MFLRVLLALKWYFKYPNPSKNKDFILIYKANANFCILLFICLGIVVQKCCVRSHDPINKTSTHVYFIMHICTVAIPQNYPQNNIANHIGYCYHTNYVYNTSTRNEMKKSKCFMLKYASKRKTCAQIN